MLSIVRQRAQHTTQPRSTSLHTLQPDDAQPIPIPLSTTTTTLPFPILVPKPPPLPPLQLFTHDLLHPADKARNENGANNVSVMGDQLNIDRARDMINTIINDDRRDREDDRRRDGGGY